MNRLTVLSLLFTLLTSTAALAGEEHGHLHEPHHWESPEVRRELLLQMGTMVGIGTGVACYLLVRRNRRRRPDVPPSNNGRE